MRPVDGMHRSDPQDYTEWCRNLFGALADKGVWGIPRSGLTFQRQGDKLVLIEKSRDYDPEVQEHEYEVTKSNFAAAGIEVTRQDV